jgi:hypothetical protein
MYMSWNIANIVNTVEIPKESIDELYAAQTYEGDIWEDPEDITEGGKLCFDPDHMEWMDYLDNPDIIGVLTKYKVKGDICFGSLEGDNANSFWGYRFDGNGNMEELEGKVEWQVKG